MGLIAEIDRTDDSKWWNGRGDRDNDNSGDRLIAVDIIIRMKIVSVLAINCNGGSHDNC